MSQYQIAVVVGSLRKDSYNRALAGALAKLAPPEFTFRQVEIGDLPLYNQDDDGSPAASVTRLKTAISEASGVLFVTPEYNRSIPGALKNAIDWASRPWGQNSFSRKPSGVIGTSPGAIGTAVAQQQLRGVLCFCNSPLMNTLEAYIQFTPGLIDDDGNVGNDGTADFLRKYLQEYAIFVQRVLTVLPRED